MAKRPEPGSDLTRLLAAGDHRGAAALARAVLADPASGEAQRAEAEAALARLRPGRAAVLALALGAALFAAALALGLLRS